LRERKIKLGVGRYLSWRKDIVGIVEIMHNELKDDA
jgi:hypothetical protein